MKILVRTSVERLGVSVSCSKKGVVTVVSKPENKILLNLFKDGLSAYEIAVKNGYTGTESEYAAESIHPQVDFTAYYILSKS